MGSYISGAERQQKILFPCYPLYIPITPRI
jgi:hypothetical protein